MERMRRDSDWKAVFLGLTSKDDCIDSLKNDGHFDLENEQN